MIIFPDTCGLLHYPQIKDVDWLKIAGEKSVKLVFTMQVIHELDEKKNDSRLGDRAAGAIKEILRSRGKTIRDGVTIEVYQHEPRIGDYPATYNPENDDDKIVHQVKKYTEQNDVTDFAVYTEDGGMMLRCETHGVRVIEPDKATRLPTILPEEEKKHREIAAELNQIKNRHPIIRISLLEKEIAQTGPLRIKLTKVPIPDENAVKQHIDELVTKEGHKLTFGPSEFVGDVFSALYPSKEQWAAHKKKCHVYLDRFREWITKGAAYTFGKAKRFGLRVEIANDGTMVGEDVDVLLKFPPILKFISEDDDEENAVGNVERFTDPPKLPREPDVLNRYMPDLESEYVPDLRAPRESLPEWSKLSGIADEGFELRLFAVKLNHHKCMTFGPFTLAFTDWEKARSFNVSVTTIAANLVDKGEATIPVIVEVKERE